ncbi:MAG: putative PEP-binding protein, partial [Pseudomonadota bacterium]
MERTIIPLAEADDPRWGVKAQRLARMIAMGAPTPPGLVFPEDAAAAGLAAAIGAMSGEADGPLLIALRSSPTDEAAPAATAILNIGLTSDAMAPLAARIGRRGALDLRRRLIQSFAVGAMGADPEAFENALFDRMKLSGADGEQDLDEAALAALVDEFLALVEDETDEPFPETLEAQLIRGVEALRRAWSAPTARILREARGADPEAGQALVAQRMALGLGPGVSGAGYAARRSEETGAVGLNGRFLTQAQGEDALMGLRTPRLLTIAERLRGVRSQEVLEELAPDVVARLDELAEAAEAALSEALALEFTVHDGEVFILDAQPLKVGARAAVRIAVDLAESGAISRDRALLRIAPSALVAHLHHSISPRARREVIGRGLAASPGAATGAIVFSPEAAEALAAREQKAILVRVETSPEDIRGMHAATGVLTARGGMTSHAAVIARGLGAPCVVGAADIALDFEANTLTTADGRVLSEGDVITLDGSAGEALAGAPELIPPELSGSFSTLMDWADQRRRMKVRANADTGQDARVAVGFNVDGIGLCRTEHMFFEKGRINTMRRMILATEESDRRAALDALLPMQRGDFVELFEIMAGLPVTIRLLDPPLHEFLPSGERELSELAEAMNLPLKTVVKRAEDMREFNPMLGKRGCRVGVAFPEIYEMQARAAFEAAVEAGRRTGEPVTPEVMIPLVSANRELELMARTVEAVAEQVRAETGAALRYKIGAMVETPRAALRAADLAQTAEFLSFGTN